jgi:hypothetical protein
MNLGTFRDINLGQVGTFGDNPCPRSSGHRDKTLKSVCPVPRPGGNPAPKPPLQRRGGRRPSAWPSFRVAP